MSTTLRAPGPLRLLALGGAAVELTVEATANGPVSLAALHGGSFAGNSLNAVTVAATDGGLVTVVYRPPPRPGTYVVQVASPFNVGRLSFTVVVP